MRTLPLALGALLLLIGPSGAMAQGGPDEPNSPPAPYRGVDPSGPGPEGPPPEAGPGPGPGPGPDAGPGPEEGPGPGPGGPADRGPGPGARRFGGEGKGAAENPNRELKRQCRDQARASGARGPEMRQAMIACIANSNPKLARRVQCGTEARGKGLKKGSDEMRSFMRSCVRAGR